MFTVISFRIALSSSAESIVARVVPRASQAEAAFAQVEVVVVTWKQFAPDKMKVLSKHL